MLNTFAAATATADRHLLDAHVLITEGTLVWLSDARAGRGVIR